MSFADKSCLTTVVQNTSGHTRRFGFLPPHGVQLANDETYTILGSLLDSWGDHIVNRRNRAALQAALDRGDMVIVETPSQILVDTVTHLSKTIKSTSGTLATQNPCFAGTDSEQSDVLP